jgi:two-component system OmpR family response regulator
MSPRHRILVAEDNHDVRELIRTRLSDYGFEVHTARNGAEALTRLRTLKPHAMVLDINMPELDGFGVLEVLLEQGHRFPVLVLTARHAADDVRRAISLGAKDYLTKPFTEAQLQARVARLLREIVKPSPPIRLVDA